MAETYEWAQGRDALKVETSSLLHIYLPSIRYPAPFVHFIQHIPFLSRAFFPENNIAISSMTKYEFPNIIVKLPTEFRDLDARW